MMNTTSSSTNSHLINTRQQADSSAVSAAAAGTVAAARNQLTLQITEDMLSTNTKRLNSDQGDDLWVNQVS